MTKPKQTDRQKLAVFDFDGTLTLKDSFMAFLKHTHGITSLIKHFLYLWPVLLLYKSKLLSNSKAKQIVFRHFFRNYPLTFLQEKATVFCKEILPQILNPEAMAKMRWHQSQGHRVVVVSAMFQPILQYWCDENGLTLLATELELINGRLSGNFSTKNCYGEEKVARLRKAGLLQDSPYLYAYGDSAGDQALLALADEAFYRRF